MTLPIDRRNHCQALLIGCQDEKQRSYPHERNRGCGVQVICVRGDGEAIGGWGRGRGHHDNGEIGRESWLANRWVF
jgi:hypothetical protein